MEGTKAVSELPGSKIQVKTLFATEAWLNAHAAVLKSFPETEAVTDKELKQLSALVTAPPVIALAEIPVYDISATDFSQTFTIVLDSIQDPGNLGTIIRIADWYGIGHIVCSPQCADVFNPKVIQSTMGSFTRVNVYYTSLETFFAKHTQLPVYGALMNGSSVYGTQLAAKGLLLIGNEGSGISAELMPYVTHPVSIPRRGGAESLNAAVATAVICDAWARAQDNA